ncbi:hypothetical protein BGW80DRAFT_1181151, partial [Lactifluus volemus]
TYEIQTEYHPRSRRCAETFPAENYGGGPPRVVPHAEPWAPFFNTHEDFLLSEILLEGGISKDLSDKLIKLVNRCVSGKGTLTLTSYSEVLAAWERASLKLTPFEVVTISVPYLDRQVAYDVPHRALWEWATDLVQDPQLAPHFHWDAEKIYRCSGESKVRVFHEPWSAEAFWNVQSQIPEGGSPLGLILYADKTKLSSFGTTMGYPVVARCANLPASIRNSNGFGGGRVVGWLPIVKNDPKEDGKPQFVNFKRAVWHESFRVVVQSIVDHSKMGCWLKCGDGIKRWLFPTVLILSADYEEQCVMSLIRGTTSKFPCPVCLVKSDELSNITGTKIWPHRTATQSQELVHQARSLKTAAQRDTFLSEHGLRSVDNVFWSLQNSDPHRALSFDRLHSNNSGLFGHHLWEQFKALISGYGRREAAQIDAQFCAVPRWSGLNHFQQVMEVAFTDGTKYEDISKIIVFVAHNVIPRHDKEGWQLLRCLRSFTIVDLYLSFEEHTADTIATGRCELTRFGQLMQEYIDISIPMDGGPPKNWNFPKMHALVHSFDDIEAKGASRNYNTKPNEKLHGPLKKSFARQTNFKNILRIEHINFVASLIRSQIDEVDDIASSDVTSGGNPFEPSPGPSVPSSSITQGLELQGKVFVASQVTLRSQQSKTTFASLSAFGGALHARLSTWLTNELVANHEDLPGVIKFHLDDQVMEYRSIRVVYESKVDWKQYVDLLYCSPSFHNRERRDCVIVRTTNGYFFAQLLLIFTCSVANTTYPICLVQPLDAHIGTHTAKDRDLRLHRIRARPNITEFIFAQTIVRGAPIIQDFRRAGDYYVMDVADHTGDLFLRCKEIFPS